MTSMKNIHGVIAPMITPFDEHGELDLEKARREAEILIRAGVDGISPGGSTGEGAMLTDGELAALIRMLRSLSPTLPIIAGVIRNSTKAAISAGMAAKEAGADALMVTPVSYTALVPDDEGNIAYYRAIAEQVGLPIIIYNVVPQNPVSTELFGKLLAIPEIYGIKQSLGGVMSFYEMKLLYGDKAKIFAATDEMMYTTFQLDADGAISAIITAFPELCVSMWQAAKDKRDTEGLHIQSMLYPVWKEVSGKQFPIRLKFVLQLLGRDPGMTRPPICHLGEDEKKRIIESINKIL